MRCPLSDLMTCVTHRAQDVRDTLRSVVELSGSSSGIKRYCGAKHDITHQQVGA